MKRKRDSQNKTEINKPNREIFLKPPFRLMTVARSQTGKTTLLIKLLLWKWVHQFNKIYIFCPTFRLDKKWSAVDKYVISGLIIPKIKFSEQAVKNVWAKCMREKVESKTEKHTLILFDDCVGQDKFKTNQETGIINQLVCRANHANVSTIWSVQKYTQASTIMRSQAEGLITFQCLQASEQKPLYQEFGMGDLKSFSNLLTECTKEPFHYIYVNRQGPGAPDYYHNFKLINKSTS